MTMLRFLPRRPAFSLSLATALLLAGGVALPSVCAAQALNPGSAAGGRRAANAPAAKPAPAPPPALPGAQATEPAAPPTRIPTDMPPTEALFDAINRGDIVAARDALSRGADLSAHNVLGMTPMDLSVDLGRNDISFLLLSMRAGEAPSGTRRQAQPMPRLAEAPTERPAGRRAAAPVRAAAPAQPVATPRLFANDGGTPIPDAGFLGFDLGRTMR